MSKKKIMTHIVAGYPTLAESEELARMMSKHVDFIEIQIPFSDPVADGPTIMKANQKALESGITVSDSFDLMEKLKGDTPLLFMSYFNILYKYGVDKFCERAAKAGCYGLIVPDIPIDEEPAEGYLAACKKHGLKAIQIVSPLTPDERLKRIGEVADGFVYCVARFGTTGQTGAVSSDLGSYMERVRKFVKVPLAVGFGISDKAGVDAVHEHADIAVIGSAVIRMLESGIGQVEDFLGSLTTD